MRFDHIAVMAAVIPMRRIIQNDNQRVHSNHPARSGEQQNNHGQHDICPALPIHKISPTCPQRKQDQSDTGHCEFDLIHIASRE